MTDEFNRKLTMAQAISEAISQEMERSADVFVMGEDIGKYGGIFGATGDCCRDCKDRTTWTRRYRRPPSLAPR